MGYTYTPVSDSQPFHNPPVLQMLLDDLVDILAVNIAVPDRFRVHDYYRSFRTAIETSRGIDPDATLAAKPQFLAALLGIVTEALRIESLTAVTAIRTQIGAEKNMISIIRHIQLIPSGTCLQDHAILMRCKNVNRLLLTG